MALDHRGSWIALTFQVLEDVTIILLDWQDGGGVDREALAGRDATERV